MIVDFDPAKNQNNIRIRGLDFAQVADFDFATTQYALDDRREYGETRWRAIGFIGERLYVLVFKPIDDGIRVISFRKANRREVNKYAQDH